MNTLWKITVLATLLLGSNSLTTAPAGTKETPSDYTRFTGRSYTQTLATLQETAKAQGYRISGVHDLAASLQKEGIERAPYAVVEVCKPEIAAQVLQAEPRLGALMPCRIAVYQQGDRTAVTTVLPTRLMALFPVKAELKAAAVRVDDDLKAIIDGATR